jgi:hypothetical protein
MRYFPNQLQPTDFSRIAGNNATKPDKETIMATIHFTWLDEHGNRSHDYAQTDNREAKLAYLARAFPNMRDLQEEILADSGKDPLSDINLGQALADAPDELVPSIRDLIKR